MPELPQIVELAARRRLLAAESELNRQTLLMEVSYLRNSIKKVKQAVRFGRVVYPFFLVAAPIAGYFLSNKEGRSQGITQKAWKAWQMLRLLGPVLEFFGNRPAKGTQD